MNRHQIMSRERSSLRSLRSCVFVQAERSSLKSGLWQEKHATEAVALLGGKNTLMGRGFEGPAPPPPTSLLVKSDDDNTLAELGA